MLTYAAVDAELQHAQRLPAYEDFGGQRFRGLWREPLTVLTDGYNGLPWRNRWRRRRQKQAVRFDLYPRGWVHRGCKRELLSECFSKMIDPADRRSKLGMQGTPRDWGWARKGM